MAHHIIIPHKMQSLVEIHYCRSRKVSHYSKKIFSHHYHCAAGDFKRGVISMLKKKIIGIYEARNQTTPLGQTVS